MMIPTTSLSDWLPLLLGALFLLIYLLYATAQKKLPPTPWHLEFSPDSKTLYGGKMSFTSPSECHGVIGAWEVATGRLLWESHMEAPVFDIELSPDGTSLLTTGSPGVISGGVEYVLGGAILWDTNTGQPRFPLTDERHDRMAGSAYFTPGGQRILGCVHEGIQVWDAQTGERLAYWPLSEGKTGWPAYLHFSADGTRILVEARSWSDPSSNIGGDAFVQLREAHTGEVLKDFPGEPAASMLSKDGERIALARYRLFPQDVSGNEGIIYCVELWSASGQLLKQSQELPPNFILLAVSFRPEGNVLCSGGYTQTGEPDRPQAFLWDIQTNQLLEQQQPASTRGVLSPDKQLRAIANSSIDPLKSPLGAIYRVDTGEKLRDLEGLAGR
ncbi:MAG: hypothetical protein QM758_07090 [Armatimonas sp.]